MALVKRLLVNIELNEFDDLIFDFVNRVAGVLKTDLKSVSFIHVTEDLDIPKAILDKYPGLVPSIDESINQAIEGKLDAFEHIKAIPEIKTTTLGGSKLQQIPEYIRENDIDLFVVNRTDTDEEEVSYLQKLIRRSSCSVALVPPSVPSNIKNILVPMDFSYNSQMALQTATALCAKHDDMHIHGLHIYNLPHGYFKTGLTKDQFIDELVNHARGEVARISKEANVDPDRFTAHYRMLNSNGVPYMINRFAFNQKIDAIVLGSRGGSTLSSFFLGRVTEALIDRDQYLPLIVVKNKGEDLKLWDALAL
ncbi:MAG: universal stress protein [Balneolaceae bacterium]|nr:universal stress protein [Balneolaceae bacterium]